MEINSLSVEIMWQGKNDDFAVSILIATFFNQFNNQIRKFFRHLFKFIIFKFIFFKYF